MLVNTDSIAMDMVALLVAFAVAALLGPFIIKQLRALNFGQNINEDAPKTHGSKQGTPTMGGVMIVLAVGVALAVVPPLMHLRTAGEEVWAVYIVFAAHAVLGFIDDYTSKRRGKSLGLKARHKLVGQFIIAVGFVLWLLSRDRPNFTTDIWLWRYVHFDLGPWYYLLVVVCVIGLSNAVNLTDGLDGLAGGLATLTAIGLAATVYTFGPFVPLPLFGYALAGACLGFLCYNAHPARVFMGDTGSLAIGAGFAAMAIVGKQEILLLILSAVFMAEMLSVMIQVTVFKATGGKGKGRRVFRMAPLHHHFELCGWPETRVVARFWIAGALALAIALLCAPYLSPWMQPQ